MRVHGRSGGLPKIVWLAPRPRATRDQEAGGEPARRVAVRTEERIARAMSYVRWATAVLVLVPLLRWRELEAPGLAVAAGLCALAESVWLSRRARRTGTLADAVLVWADAAFAVLLVFAVSRTVAPSLRNSGLTEVVSFALASAGFAGFGLGLRAAGAVVPVALGTAWAAAVWPDFTVKLVSDGLGFLLWYGVCVLAGREFRTMAALADEGQAKAAAVQAEMAERRREADIAREREITHGEIHEHLLPIVDAVAAGRAMDGHLEALARRAAHRARLLLVDGRVVPAGGAAALLADVRDTYVEAGLPLAAVFRIEGEPPAEVAEAVAAAAREALSNVLKYAGGHEEVTLFAEVDADSVEVVVRDRGIGFDPATARAGNGLRVTFAAVRRRGGDVRLTSTPGAGTRVTIVWPARPHAAPAAGPARPGAAETSSKEIAQ